MAKILIGNIKGPQGPQGPQGEQGPVGPQGPQGPLPPLVNNALATEAGVAALDAAMGKTLQDQITNNKNDITELNSNLATAIYSSDLMAAYNNPTFVRWDQNTSNTPYKAGLTTNQNGFAICYGTYSNFQTIIAFIQGDGRIYAHYNIGGFPSGWQSTYIIPESNKADALDISSASGIYKVDSSTLNNPPKTYGVEILLKDANSNWIFAIIIPTNLSAIYFDFYNGYGDDAGWSGWRKVDLTGIS